MVRLGTFLAGCAIGGAGALAQFSDQTVTTSSFAWILGGELLLGEGAPTPEAGDEIGVFFGDRLVGVRILTADQAQALEYAQLLVYGDDPATAEDEGPGVGDVITFRFYDASTNTVVVNVRAVNEQGEPVNLAFNGGPFLNFPGLPFPIGNFQEQDLRIGAGAGDGDGGDGGGGGGGGTPTGDPDVDGDGVITRKDAAMVLRVVVGGGRLVDEATAARADVNGDGTVSTEDAIAVLRARQ